MLLRARRASWVSGPAPGTSGEKMVELSQACGRDRALAMRQGRERRVEVRAQAEPESDRAKPNDLGTHRERRHEL